MSLSSERTAESIRLPGDRRRTLPGRAGGGFPIWRQNRDLQCLSHPEVRIGWIYLSSAMTVGSILPPGIPLLRTAGTAGGG